MARPIYKVSRFFVSLNQLEEDMLKSLMNEDGKLDRSAYVGFMVSELHKKRQEEKVRRVGRPSTKEEEKRLEEEEASKWYYPPNFGYDGMKNQNLYHKEELEAHCAFMGYPMPDPLVPLTEEQLVEYQLKTGINPSMLA